MAMSVPNRPEVLSAKLAALPRFEPAPALWERIEAARPRRPAPSWPGWSMAAALVVAALGVAAGLAPVHDAPAPRPASLAAHLDEARALEAALIDARAAGVSNPDVLALERELASSDAALQSAYDRRADARELDALWHARVERLSQLVVAYRHSASLVRL
jgi:hypothetical protein